jgi:hypothetical protein
LDLTPCFVHFFTAHRKSVGQKGYYQVCNVSAGVEFVASEWFGHGKLGRDEKKGQVKWLLRGKMFGLVCWTLFVFFVEHGLELQKYF